MAPKVPSDANALGALGNQEIGSLRHSPAFDCLLIPNLFGKLIGAGDRFRTDDLVLGKHT